MKLNKQTIDLLVNVVKTSKIVDIDKVIIEPNHIRGTDENCSVVILDFSNVQLDFGSIALNRLDTFISRHELVRAQDGFAVEAETDDNEQFVRKLTFKGSGTKIDYRCANPTTLQRVPKNIKDEMFIRVPINGEAVRLLQKGQGAMGNPETVTILCNNNQVSFEITDINNDVFKHTLTEDIQILQNDVDSTFVYRYPLKTILSMFRSNPDGFFEIGSSKGVLKFPISDLALYVIPRV